TTRPQRRGGCAGGNCFCASTFAVSVSFWVKLAAKSAGGGSGGYAGWLRRVVFFFAVCVFVFLGVSASAKMTAAILGGGPSGGSPRESLRSSRGLEVYQQSSVCRWRDSARNVTRNALRARVSCDSSAFSDSRQRSAISRCDLPCTYF